MFFLSCVCNAFVRVCLFVPCGHPLGKGNGLLTLVCGVYCEFVTFTLVSWVRCVLDLSIPDLCTLTYFYKC